MSFSQNQKNNTIYNIFKSNSISYQSFFNLNYIWSLILVLVLFLVLFFVKDILFFNINYIILILKFLCLIVPLLIAVAYFTLLERKVMAAIQVRRGPNVVGFLGLLQPLADGLKLFIKETILPSNANIFLFIFAPILTLFLSLTVWVIVPFNYQTLVMDSNVGVLYVLAISSLSIYGVIMSGWASNSKYAFLGSLRCVAQMISYEVSFSFCIICVLFFSESLNLSEIILSQETCFFFIPLFPLFLIASVSILAETNRHPFDLPEAEAELVSGYNVEYSAMGFALFFLGEYGNMLFMSAFLTIFFLGGWLYFSLFIKMSVFVLLFIFARAAFPRYRYDQLMSLGWKVYLPFTLGLLIFFISLVFIFSFIKVNTILNY